MRFRLRNQEGASLIEFALIMPLLVLLILGIVDAGWAFFQNLEVRHGAREVARMAVVDLDPGGSGATQEARLINEACARMTADDKVWVALYYDGTDIGDTVTAVVVRQHSSLTGILPFFDNIQLSSEVEMRIEQPPDWSEVADGVTPPVANPSGAGMQQCP
jgi:Flp pilus assembly protein TadG